MSEENNDVVAEKTEDKAPTAPRRHLTRAAVTALLEERGLTAHEMTSFDRVGPKDGPHLTISRAQKIMRVYGHGFQLEVPGVNNFSEEDRRANKRGGITCQLDVEGSETDVALAALGAMLDHVKSQPAPVEAADPAPAVEPAPDA